MMATMRRALGSTTMSRPFTSTYSSPWYLPHSVRELRRQWFKSNLPRRRGPDRNSEGVVILTCRVRPEVFTQPRALLRQNRHVAAAGPGERLRTPSSFCRVRSVRCLASRHVLRSTGLALANRLLSKSARRLFIGRDVECTINPGGHRDGG